MKMFVLYIVDWYIEIYGVFFDMIIVDEEELVKKFGWFYCEVKL